eukprot:3970621-Pyramimonas_sp.AAC.2
MCKHWNGQIRCRRETAASMWVDAEGIPITLTAPDCKQMDDDNDDDNGDGYDDDDDGGDEGKLDSQRPCYKCRAVLPLKLLAAEDEGEITRATAVASYARDDFYLSCSWTGHDANHQQSRSHSFHCGSSAVAETLVWGVVS